MGYLSASDMTNSPLSIEQQLTWHLTSNHYPPVPTSMVPVCVAAIDAIVGDEPNASIPLPDGITYRGDEFAPAWAIAESHHLHAFVDACLAYDEDDDTI